MKELFVPYELALEFKELEFDKPCFGYHLCKNSALGVYLELTTDWIDLLPYDSSSCKAPTYLQAIDWFQEKYGIYVGRTGYNDGKTPKRWVFHVDDYYVQDQSWNGAIKYAIELVKNKIKKNEI